ncbi:ATP-grasp domain-containing protein [Rubrivivax gelatinosus]|uniref:ATP-grasp domain-containing protein n=1 Tax=Rubrivivax gelatinosus (strain NBRC 100245 / IL144) TaxID=983917 RepID=I0HWI5_RUBGI|nr:ATP-grasp domain-containing protein [Rubrivivax gelatinosus]BAL97372.1 hypothetical protein RGE_40360 [Rubrivivax gelatinosus IL144]
MTRVFVYEYLSGGGLVDGDPAASTTLMPLGQAMRDAMARDLLRARLGPVTVATCAAAGPVPAGTQAVCAAPGEAPEVFVARQAARHDLVWAVAPESDGLLAAMQAAVGRSRWLGCDAAAIALASSKGATLARLRAHGIATPHDLADEATRWVVKPDDGAGAVATQVWTSRGAAAADARRRENVGAAAWLEPWVDGEPMSLSLLARAGHAELLSVNRQRIAVDGDGLLRYDGVDLDCVSPNDPRRATLATLAGRVAAAIPGLAGFAGVDFVWHPARGPVAIEVNPRTTCAFVGLSERLGRCLAADIVAARRETLHA